MFVNLYEVNTACLLYLPRFSCNIFIYQGASVFELSGIVPGGTYSDKEGRYAKLQILWLTIAR